MKMGKSYADDQLWVNIFISGFLASSDKIANKINVKILKKLKSNLNKLILINAFDALKA
jgi:hypothetical protein